MVEIFCGPFISILMGGLFFKCTFSFSSNSSIPSSKKKESKKRKKPFVVRLSEGDKHQPLLTGPPQTKGFQSGRVLLQPGEDVGKHSTKHYEEALIILEGKGEALSEGNEPLAIEAGYLVYIPPYTEHNIKNTGATPLKYIYLVAPTE